MWDITLDEETKRKRFVDVAMYKFGVIAATAQLHAQKTDGWMSEWISYDLQLNKNYDDDG